MWGAADDDYYDDDGEMVDTLDWMTERGRAFDYRCDGLYWRERAGRGSGAVVWGI